MARVRSEGPAWLEPGDRAMGRVTMIRSLDLILFFFLSFFAISWASPVAYGGSQTRGRIGAVAASLRQSHSNAGSEPRLQPTPQLTAMPDP